jgi:hypothetical protein
MNTDTAELLERASDIVRTEPFDLSSYGTCAAAAIYRATGSRGIVDQPEGDYAGLLARVVRANGIDERPGQDDLDALHEGVWAVMKREDCTAQEATLSIFATARDACAKPVRELAMA